MNKDIWQKFIKFILILIIYIFYGKIIGSIFSLIGINGIFSSFFSDIIFFIGIVWFYKDNLKQDYKKYREYTLKEKGKILFKNLGLVFLVFLFMGILTEIFLPDAANVGTENNQMITSLFGTSLLYTLFKTLIFATIAEELVFREAMSEIVTNKKLLVIISSFIYAVMNVIYGDLTNTFLWLDFVQYFLFYIILSMAYVKYDYNIFVPISIKFIYNLFQTILLVLISIVG